MSWLKKRSQNSTPSPAPFGQPTEPVPMFNPNQANQWQPNNWHHPQQQNHPPAQQQNYWEHSGYPDQHNQQSYNQNVQQYQQHQNQNTIYGNNAAEPQPNQQMYGNLQFNQQYNTQNNSFQSVPLQNNENDGWASWGWGDEDNSNIQSAQLKPNKPVNDGTSNFTNDESWNWSVEDSGNQVIDPNFEEGTVSKESSELFPKMGQLAKSGSGDQSHPSEIAVSPQPFALTSVKKSKLETPQWSIESQVSQESSDDILQTSESDNHLVSSSTISHSPLSGMDSLQPAKEELPPENPSPVYHQQIENREIVTNTNSNMHQQHQSALAPVSAQSFVPLASATLVATEDSKNPYKRASSNPSQKSAPISNQFPMRQFSQPFNQSVNMETPPDNSEHPDVPQNPTAKSFVMPSSSQRLNQHQNWQDNNEAPMNDRNQYLETGQLSDANQHSFASELEQEGAGGLRSNQEDTLPPPGLRRMVLGQIEQQETVGNRENFSDEPPPGLSRMVLGQNETNSMAQLNSSGIEGHASNTFEPISPPEGLRRMVPGESSSPENSLRQPVFQSENPRNDDSDQEFGRMPQLRSATIGADTPPATSMPIAAPSNLSTINRSETIGADDSGENLRGSSMSPVNGRKSGRRTDKKFDNQRRDYIEGQQLESDLGSVVAGVRNLTMGENSTDEANESNLKMEPRRKLSRQDTSESENDNRGKSPRDRKDRRYKADRRERDNYSPEPSRDRRYDRRKYRDRQYDDNGDYFSDGERDKSNKDREQDKKYYSLRKDKERDRRRRGGESPREYERDSRRKRDDYYHRYEDSYDNEERSRPSSRSDSMHDSMYRGNRRPEKDPRDRRRDRPRDRDKHRRPRDPYNPYSQGYGGYDPYNQYYQQYQYQYYENLRRTNPQAYAEIYRKYYEQRSSRHPPAYGADDRSSVHSGRSSANEDLAKDRYTRQSYYSQSSMPYMAGYYGRDSKTNSISGHYDLDESSFSRHKDHTDSYTLHEDSSKAGRMTPAKFMTAHMKASIESGRLVKISPNYPQDGQLALVEILNLEAYLQKDDEYKELANYPGPLIKGVTHKKTVIEYCENKIKSVGGNLDISDPDSYILMWELLILLLRQNGKVVGTDIAELLLKNRTENLPVRPPSVLSNISSNTGDIPPISESSNPQLSEGNISLSNLKEEEVTNKFREYLLYGSGQEALEWAMKHGLWGHALFLASKLGKRTYSNVMVRFANGLTLNDPLQTLYQLLSGRIPAAVSGVADEKWGDWKPHLAMMLSNSSLQPELNRKAITALGDTLMARGSLYAAQFCYLMAEVGFGRYGTENTKVVLLGSNHNKPFAHFATNEAIHMTEIYEYACSLNDPEFALPELQVYKYLLATRLADRGLLEKSLAYLEKIAIYVTNNPSNVQSSLVNNVCNLADRLKYYDPVSAEDEEDNVDGGVENRLDNSWLKNLRIVQDNINTGIVTDTSNNVNNDVTLTNPAQSNLYDTTLDSPKPDTWNQPQFYATQYQPDNSQMTWQPEQQAQADTSMDGYQQPDQQQTEGYSSLSYQDQQQMYWTNQQQQQQQPWENSVNHPGTENLDQDQQNYYGSSNTQKEEEGRPNITIPNQTKGKSYFDNDEPLPHEKTQKSKAPVKADPLKDQKQNSTGWFGGIFSKLALKPKNQMKLPDDKNPTIVWDEDKKRWINVDEDNNVSSNEMKAPPKLSDMKPLSTKPPLPQVANNNNNNNSMPQSYANPVSFNNNVNVSSQPGQVPMLDNSMQMIGQENSQQGNMFKLQKSRNLKKSYIDVFNPGGGTKSTSTAPSLHGFPPQGAPQMNFFVPQPVDDPNAPTNFLTQATPVIQLQHDDQLSRWSSASSLSKEVQYYMRHKPPRPVR